MIERFQLLLYATAVRLYERIGFLFRQGTATEGLNRYIELGKLIEEPDK
jgi:hypothetical protein